MMGAAEKLDTKMVEFFENKSVTLEEKNKTLMELRSNLFESAEIDDHHVFEEAFRKLHAYCEITEKHHPETHNAPQKVMSGWQNIRDGCALR